MAKNSLVVIAVEEELELTLDEICQACNVAPEFIQGMMDYGAIEPKGVSDENLRFGADHLQRVRIARHLHVDLEVNLAGVALVLDMLQEMQVLRNRLEILEKHYF